MGMRRPMFRSLKRTRTVQLSVMGLNKCRMEGFQNQGRREVTQLWSFLQDFPEIPHLWKPPKPGIHVQWVKGAWVENPVQHPR